MKKNDMFEQRETFLRQKYSKNVNNESGEKSFEIQSKQPLNMEDLGKKTQEEIFLIPHYYRKPLNFMNYSNQEYDVINGTKYQLT